MVGMNFHSNYYQGLLPYSIVGLVVVLHPIGMVSIVTILFQAVIEIFWQKTSISIYIQE